MTEETGPLFGTQTMSGEGPRSVPFLSRWPWGGGGGGASPRPSPPGNVLPKGQSWHCPTPVQVSHYTENQLVPTRSWIWKKQKSILNFSNFSQASIFRWLPQIRQSPMKRSKRPPAGTPCHLPKANKHQSLSCEPWGPGDS